MPPFTPNEHKSSKQLNQERKNLEICVITLSDFYMCSSILGVLQFLSVLEELDTITEII